MARPNDQSFCGINESFGYYLCQLDALFRCVLVVSQYGRICGLRADNKILRLPADALC